MIFTASAEELNCGLSGPHSKETVEKMLLYLTPLASVYCNLMHQPPAPVSDNDAVGELEVDYTASKSVTTSLDGSTPSRSTPPRLSPYVCSYEDDTEPPGTTCSSLEEPRGEEEISASPASTPADEDDVKNQRAEEDVEMPAPAPTPAAVWLDCHRCIGKRCVLATGYCSVCGARSSLWQN